MIDQTQPNSNQKKSTSSTATIVIILIIILVVILGLSRWWPTTQLTSNWWQRWRQPETQTQPAAPEQSTVPDLTEPIKMIDVSDVVELVKPSIVTVAVKTTQVKAGQTANSLDQLLPLMMFGYPNSAPRSLETEEVQQDIGSGFVVDSSGLVVTNKHVVSDTTTEYIVIDHQEKEHQVTEIYRDPENDLAILQVVDLEAPALNLGDSDQLKVGQGVIAVGTALGEFRQTVTTGVVSGLGRSITASNGRGQQQSSLTGLIQTDAAINSGNSGGPLLDHRGHVIGVNVATTAGAQNIGFALPIDLVKESLANFTTTGRFDRPFLGVNYQLISAKAALVNEIPAGAYVIDVQADSPAAKAGLQAGDIITKFAGQKIGTSLDDDTTEEVANELSTLINHHQVGDQVTLEYYRGDQSHTVDIVLEKKI